MKYKNKNKYIVLTAVWMIVIFIFSSQNGELSSANNAFVIKLLEKIGIDALKVIPDINFWIRKAAHLTEYLILGVLLFKTYRNYLYSRFEVAAVVSGFLYACSDEIHQYFVPGRACSFRDVLIDTAGITLGVFLISIWKYKRFRKLKNKAYEI